ncbi:MULTISPECIES: transglutaminase family protein [Thermodesulfovibrio]|uniref:transglutaminase family protein n=1 Tax=Thermodesulfovibrio TaxID=28261 RepID=UPI002621A586|nr:DUF3488 and transglutaminase-like domain-containing protein [Thermodesulfovibrio sp.]
MKKIDNILFILSLIIVIIPFTGVYTFVSFHISLIFAVFLTISIVFHIKKFFLPSWILNVFSVFFIVLSFLKLSYEDILTPSLEALTAILSIRMIGRKTPREYLQIYLIAIFLLGGSSLVDMSLNFLIRLIFILILSVMSILLLAYFKDTNEKNISNLRLLSFFKISLLIATISIPMSAFFFFTLPRTPYPLMNLSINKSKTGFTSVVNLGSVAVIEEDSTTVMRVQVRELSDRDLYWRVITFDNFDGKKWTKTLFRENKISIKGQPITYTAVLEPFTENYLPTLDYPSNVFIRHVTIEEPATFRTNFSIDKPLKYTAVSQINPTIIDYSPSEHYLKLPVNLSERVKKLTKQITEKATNEKETAREITKFLSNYRYSLRNLPSGENPLEDFLFNKKTGNCEYFATSMAIMLRIKGIPSRVVGGFRGGTYNKFGNYYIIKASDAHLWVEAWIDGQWHRFDPSGRILRTAEPMIFHIIDYLWNAVIIDYDLMTQLKIVKSIKPPELKINRKFIIAAILSMLMIILIVKVFKNYRQNRNPLSKFFAIMKKYGYERKETEGLREFLMTVSDAQLKQNAEKFIEIYEKTYFRDEEFTARKIKELKKILEDLNESYKSRKSHY